jgi:hypothetical protein
VAFDRDELHRKSCDYASTVDRHVREEGKFLSLFEERWIPQSRKWSANSRVQVPLVRLAHPRRTELSHTVSLNFKFLPRLWGKNGLVFEYAGTLGRAPPLGGHLPRADDDHIMFPSESG